MPQKYSESQLKLQILNLQKEKLKKRWAKKKQRESFVKKNLSKILSLSMEGWPRTKNMNDYSKWLDLVFAAKIKGVYGICTSNCDVIMLLSRLAKDLKTIK